MRVLDTGYVLTAIGVLEVAGDDEAIASVKFTDQVSDVSVTNRVVRTCMRQLQEYFSGKRRRFSVPLAPRGTAFQQAVWKELLRIPYSKTSTYGAVAKAIGRPRAARAVGGATGRNPIAVVIPCHRVLAADGRLTGYAGGLERKSWLLEREGGPARGTSPLR